MKCKFCLAELEEDVTVCPACGKNLEEPAEELVEEPMEEPVEEAAEEAAEEEPKKKMPKALMITLAAVAGVVLAAVLTLAVLYGMGIKWKSVTAFFGFTEAGLDYKNSFTVSDKKMDKKADVVIAQVGNQTLTNEDLQVYYWMSVRNFVDYYGYYLESLGLSTAEPLNKQIYDEKTGETWQQYFLKNALESWRRYASLAQMAEDSGYVLDAELQAYLDTFEQKMNKLAIEAGYADGEELVDISVSKGSSMAAYYKYVRTEYMALGYLESLSDKLKPTAEEIEAYYAANEETLKQKGYGKEDGYYYAVRHILIGIEGESTKDENGKTVYTDAQWETCRAAAQKLLDEFLAAEPTEEKFAELAKEHSEDPGSASNGGLYEGLTKNYGFIKNFEDWYIDESRKPGDTGLVQNTESSVQGYHIMYFSSSKEKWKDQVETQVLSEKTSKLLEDAETQWPMTINYKKIVLGNADLTKSSK